MKIVAVTACPTGIAHTYMAAEQLEKTGRKLGHRDQGRDAGRHGHRERAQRRGHRAAPTWPSSPSTSRVQTRERFEKLKIVEVPVQEAIKNPEALFARLARLERSAAMTGIAFTFPLAAACMPGRPACCRRPACPSPPPSSSATSATAAAPTPAASWRWSPATPAAAIPACLEISGPDQERAARALRDFLRAAPAACRRRPGARKDLPSKRRPRGGARTGCLPPVFLEGGQQLLQGLTLVAGPRPRPGRARRRRPSPGRAVSPPGKKTRSRSCGCSAPPAPRWPPTCGGRRRRPADRNASGILQRPPGHGQRPGLPGAHREADRSSAEACRRAWPSPHGRRQAQPATCGARAAPTCGSGPPTWTTSPPGWAKAVRPGRGRGPRETLPRARRRRGRRPLPLRVPGPGPPPPARPGPGGRGRDLAYRHPGPLASPCPPSAACPASLAEIGAGEELIVDGRRGLAPAPARPRR